MCFLRKSRSRSVAWWKTFVRGRYNFWMMFTRSLIHSSVSRNPFYWGKRFVIYKLDDNNVCFWIKQLNRIWRGVYYMQMWKITGATVSVLKAGWVILSNAGWVSSRCGAWWTYFWVVEIGQFYQTFRQGADNQEQMGLHRRPWNSCSWSCNMSCRY